MEERPEDETKMSHKLQIGPDDIKNEVNSNQSTTVGVFMHNVFAKWTPEYAENTLTDISLSVKQGELLAVIGTKLTV